MPFSPSNPEKKEIKSKPWRPKKRQQNYQLSIPPKSSCWHLVFANARITEGTPARSSSEYPRTLFPVMGFPTHPKRKLRTLRESGAPSLSLFAFPALSGWQCKCCLAGRLGVSRRGRRETDETDPCHGMAHHRIGCGPFDGEASMGVCV